MTPDAIVSHFMMPPKMLTKMPRTFGSAVMILNAAVDALLGGAAADVEEVRGLAAEVLDGVHRRHRQAGAVDHAADVAVELDERQVVALGLGLGRVLLVEVAQRLQILLPVERVVVERHLGVERQHPTVLQHDQRVDLQQRGVGGDEGPVDLQDQLGRVLGGAAVQAQAVGEVARLDSRRGRPPGRRLP